MTYLPYLFAGALLGAIYVFPQQAMEAARQGLSVWAVNVAPSLGPGMALSLYVCSHLKGGRSVRVLASVLCGSPGGARLMLHSAGDKKSALGDAALTGVMSPLFFLGTLSLWLGHEKRAVLVYACHLMGAVIASLFFKGARGEIKTSSPLGFFHCVQQSANALMMVGFLLMLGGVGARMLQCTLPFFPAEGMALLHCLLEVTGGIRKLTEQGSPHLLPLLCGAASFGGLSILLQNFMIWRERGVKFWQLALIRLLHGGISFLLCFLLEKLPFFG